MFEDKTVVEDELLSQVSGGGHMVDPYGHVYQDQSEFAVLEKQPVEDETGLHCPIEGCPGFLHFDWTEGNVWKFTCMTCGRVFLKRQIDLLWMGKI